MDNITVLDMLNNIHTDVNNLMLVARMAAEGFEMEENHAGAAGMYIVENELERMLKYIEEKRMAAMEDSDE